MNNPKFKTADGATVRFMLKNTDDPDGPCVSFWLTFDGKKGYRVPVSWEEDYFRGAAAVWDYYIRGRVAELEESQIREWQTTK